MTDRDHRFERLRVQYAQSLPAKREALVQAWRAFEAAPHEEARLRELATLLHRLSGSAGAYGYERIGLQARAADRLIDTAPTGDPLQWIHALAATVQALLDDLASAIAALPAGHAER